MTEEEKKDLIHVEIRNKGRISMLYLPRRTAELMSKIQKENPEISGWVALTKAREMLKDSEK
ncbi:hypothetical protein [uncultured Prevotella sp.]|uniref:hypothetical protein n=1 Tax=uncultured Prevotella sp. TaxID=159272 RepID=UPI0025E644E6|nr:hypothetical protein [uncultured Prevotella sp.]